MWISETERNYHDKQERNWREARIGRRKGKQSKAHKRLSKEKLQRERAMAGERCREYLKLFLSAFAEASVERKLALLKEAANPPWPKVSKRLWTSLRGRYWGSKLRFQIPAGECPACESEMAREAHHIIPLSFGGVNELLNLVRIGFNCHEQIHPWLKVSPRLSGGPSDV